MARSNVSKTRSDVSQDRLEAYWQKNLGLTLTSVSHLVCSRLHPGDYLGPRT